MRMQKIEVIDYRAGDESRVAERIRRSELPLLLRPVAGLPDEIESIELEAFLPNDSRKVLTYEYDRSGRATVQSEDGRRAIRRIIDNDPVRVFGFPVSPALEKLVLEKVALFRGWPVRRRAGCHAPTLYFLGARGANTAVHFDRERNSILHLALEGRKRVLLFSVDQSRNLYKKPLISDSWVDFARPIDEIEAEYPWVRQARAYDVRLNPGEFLYLPTQCWHYTEYIEPSAAVTYVLYPRKIDHLLGYLGGLVYLGFGPMGLRIGESRLVRHFGKRYSVSTGPLRVLYRSAELALLGMLAPLCASYAFLASRRGKTRY